MREISRRLGRSPSTISRELRRTMRRHDRGKYDAVLAHARSREKARRARGGLIGKDLVLRDLEQEKLILDWSPKQISFWLRETHPQKKSWHVCHETIFQAVYWPRNSGLTRKLTAHLHKRRRRPDVRSPRFIAPATLIDHRPAVIEERSRLGDKEGDLIIDTKSRSAIGTLVDRKSGYVLLLLHLPDTHPAVEVNAALTVTLSKLPPHLRRTLTWAHGSEMANHDKIASLFDDGVFFAHPGKPWQRGSNENMNGLPDTARIVLDSAGLVGPDVRFAYLGLEEPSKQEFYGMGDAASIDRRVRTFLLNVRTGVSIDALVNLTRSTVERRHIIDVVAEGQVAVPLEEFDSIEEILALDEGWCASLRARGLTPDDVKVAPLSAGVFDFPDEAGKRLLREVPFLETARGDPVWAHPIDNLVAFIDMIECRVDRLIDHGAVRVPAESGNYDDPKITGRPRTSLRVIDISQPDGPSF